MCGFLGRITPHADPSDLSKGLPWAGRRGPDSSQIWTSADRKVQLLHARLAIVDKDPRSNQPMTDPSGSHTVCFAGEIYNYQELKQKLAGYPYRTTSDTEVILAAYALHGIDGLRMLKGMFSLVLVDERKKRVLLARDAIGKKPLFLARWGSEALFGTGLISLAAVFGDKVELNEKAAQRFWTQGFIPPETTVFSNAVPVPPGRLWELDWSGNVTAQESCKPAPQRVYGGEPLAEAQKNVQLLLKQAVRRRLEGNPVPTLLLSGGIDSTVTTAIAAQCAAESGQTLRVLTLGAAVPGLNDELFALYAGRKIGVKVEIIRPELRSLPEAVLKAVDLQDEPLGMLSFFPLERLVRAAAQRSRILISGDGGDEVFLGYGKPRDWKASDRTSKLPEDAGFLASDWMGDWGRRAVTTDLVGHGFPKLDRASAEQGVEIRCPLLDVDLAAYVRSLPFEVLIRENRPKALLKDQLSGWPGWFTERPKLGFTYNLRWIWGLSRYAGLREAIDVRAMELFREQLPELFSGSPVAWKTADLWKHFEAAWRLMTWSRFLTRLDTARGGR